MNEFCQLKQKDCMFCGSWEMESYCGQEKLGKENKIKLMKGCPLEAKKPKK